MQFNTKKTYDERSSKIEYLHDKYKPILKGNILDVGADECYLRGYLDAGIKYTGIGMGGNPDIEVNLEKEKIPFPDNTFDCVLCLDVLEHLDNIHNTFDELCRVTNKYVIISLPNSYRDFLGMLFGSPDSKSLNFKYYGLPAERPNDRHKWFFSNSDAIAFIEGRATKNGMKIVQIDTDGSEGPRTFKSFVKRSVLNIVSVASCVKATDLYYKTMWAVLEKDQS